MPEPIAIAAGVGSLVTTAHALSKIIYENIDSVKKAPRHLRATSRDLKSFYCVLGNIAGFLGDTETAGGLLHPATLPDLQDVLENCIRLFQELYTIVNEYLKDVKSADVARWHCVEWAWREKEVKVLQDCLSAHKITLNVAIATANLINTTLARAAVQSVEQEIKNLKSDLTAFLIGIKPNVIEHEDKDTIIENYRASIAQLGPSASAIQSIHSTDRPPSPSLALSISTVGERAHTKLQQTRSLGTAATVSEYHTAAPSLLESQHLVSAVVPVDQSISQTSELRHPPCTQLFVKGFYRRTIVINVSCMVFVAAVKKYLQDEYGLPWDKVRLRYGGRPLDDDYRITCIPHNATLHGTIPPIGSGYYESLDEMRRRDDATRQFLSRIQGYRYLHNDDMESDYEDLEDMETATRTGLVAMLFGRRHKREATSMASLYSADHSTQWYDELESATQTRYNSYLGRRWANRPSRKSRWSVRGKSINQSQYSASRTAQNGSGKSVV